MDFEDSLNKSKFSKLIIGDMGNNSTQNVELFPQNKISEQETQLNLLNTFEDSALRHLGY